MLFDLRSKHRRRAVKLTYAFLAVLMGGGLVLFGVGGGPFSTGILNNVGSNGGGGSAGDLVKPGLAATHRKPSDPGSWALLAHEYYVQATTVGYDATRSTFTTLAAPSLRQMATAWQRYLALKPASFNPNLAIEAATALQVLNRPAEALPAMKIAVSASPSSNGYLELAALYYEVKRIKDGDRAGAQALRLSPAAYRLTIQTYLKFYKDRATGKLTTRTSSTAKPAAGKPATSSGGATTTTHH